MIHHVYRRLESLDLSNNKLTGVPASFLRRTPRLTRLLLDNNLLETVMLEVKQKQHTGGKFLQTSSMGRAELLLGMIH